MLHLFILLLSYSNFIFAAQNDDEQGLGQDTKNRIYVVDPLGLDTDNSSFLKEFTRIIMLDASTHLEQNKKNSENCNNEEEQLDLDFSTYAPIVHRALSSIPWIDEFYKKKKEAVEKDFPEIAPYFNEDTIFLLFKDIDHHLDDLDQKSKEDFLWNLFLDTYTNVFKQVFQNLSNILRMRNLDGTIPFNLNIDQKDLYQDSIIEALLKTKLDYKKDQGSFILAKDSKASITRAIVEHVDHYVNLKIKDFHGLYRPYSPDKEPVWISSYIKEQLKQHYNQDKNFIKFLSSQRIVGRIAYDISEVANKEENQDSTTQQDVYKKIEEEQQKFGITHFYNCLYNMLLGPLYMSFDTFRQENPSLQLKEEDVIDYFAEAFSVYPYNMFYRSDNHIKIAPSFAKYLIDNFIKKINWEIHRKNGYKDNLPLFVLKDTSFGNHVHRMESYRIKTLGQKEEKERLLENRKREQAYLAALTAKQIEEQQEKEKKHQRFLEHQEKIKKEKEQEEKRKKEEQEKLLKAQEERNKASQAAADLLQQEKFKTLNLLHSKSLKIVELQEILNISKKSKKVDDLIGEIQRLIKQQDGLLDKKKGKALKDGLKEVTKNILEIDKKIEEIQQLLNQSSDVSLSEENVVLADTMAQKNDVVMQQEIVVEVDSKATQLLEGLSSLKKGRQNNPYSLDNPMGLHKRQELNQVTGTSSHKRVRNALEAVFYPEKYVQSSQGKK